MKMRCKFFVFLVLQLISRLGLAKTVETPEAFVTVVGSAMSAPFLLDVADKEKTARGLNKDYVEALAHRMGMVAEIKVLPKYRIKEYAEHGKIDMNCYTNPKWAGPEIGEVFWSKPLFVVRDLLISRSQPVTRIQEVYGKTVGVVFSYKYPGEFDAAVDAGRIKKDESPNELSILTKLANKRIDYGIVPHMQLAFYLRENRHVKINTKGFVLVENEIRCWVRKNGPVKLERLNRAIDEMKKSGELEAIFDRYR